MKRINDILYAVAFTVVVVLGLSFAAYAAYNSVQTYKSRSWPSVSGTVIYSRTEVVVRRSGNGKRPVIKYRYDVNGTEYVGDRIAFAHAFDTEEYAEGKAADYPVGKKVVVHYNPTDPSL